MSFSQKTCNLEGIEFAQEKKRLNAAHTGAIGNLQLMLLSFIPVAFGIYEMVMKLYNINKLSQ